MGVVIGTLSIAIALGCADGVDPASTVHGSLTAIGDGKANTVQVSPSSASVLRGATTPLKCLALDSRGVIISTTPTWTISDPGVAAVDATGSVTGERGGTTMASCMVDGKAASSAITVIESPVTFLEMSPGADALTVGGSAQLVGTPLDSTDAAIAGYPVQWSTPDTTVAVVSPSGMVVAKGVGTANVIATSGGQTSFAKISVSKIPPSSVKNVAISLSPSTLNVGQVAHGSATTSDSTGQVLSGRSIVWSSSNNSVLSVVANGANNVKVTGKGTGSAKLIATSGGATTSMTLVVGSAPVQTVTVSLGSSKLIPGQTTQATATLTDGLGNVLTGRTVTWSSLDPTIASVSSSGVVTAVATGSVIIRATSEGQTGDATETVGVDPVASVSVTLASGSIVAGQTTQATAVARDASGNVLNGLPVSWSSLNTSIATVSITGVVTAVTAGTATIRATVESQIGNGSLTVGAASQTPPTSPTSPPTTPPAPTTATVVVTLDSSSMIVGSVTQAHAVAKDAAGNVLSGKTPTWSSLNATNASVSSTGLVTAKVAGPVSIQAIIDTAKGTASLVVNTPPAQTPPPTQSTVSLVLDAGSYASGSYALEAQTTLSGVGYVQFMVDGKAYVSEWVAKYCLFGGDGSCNLGSLGAGAHTIQAGAYSASGALLGQSAVLSMTDGSSSSSPSTPPPSSSPPSSPPPSSSPPATSGSLAEPVFDGTQNTMIYQTDFENYSNASLNPSSQSGVTGFVNKLLVYGSAPAGTNTTTSLVAGHSGQAMQFQYTGTSQESPGVMLIGPPQSPATATNVIQHWVKLSSPSGARMDTTRFQIKWLMLWHQDGNRLQFSTTAGNGGCNYNNDPSSQTKWNVWDLAYTGCNAMQPLYPAFPTVADGQWHRITYLVKTNTSPGSRDGRALMWIDGVLVIRIEQTAVGVVPSGAYNGQPWCVQADVDNIDNAQGVGSPEFGGPLTNGSTPFSIAVDDFKWWRQ